MTKNNPTESVDRFEESVKTLVEMGFCLNALAKNKYDLTELEQVQFLSLTPKEKKAFLKDRR